MGLDPITTVRKLASKERCPSALIVDFFVSVRIYICDKHFCLPPRTPVLLGVSVGSAEGSISQPLLKGGVVTGHDCSPQDVSRNPVCSLSGADSAAVPPLPVTWPFSFPETQHGAELEPFSCESTVTRRRMDS